MPRINLNHNEFLDFIMVMLYDIIKNDNYLNKNERFNVLKSEMIQKGMKPLLFQYYLQTDSDIRKEYKQRFKRVLSDDSKKPGTLFIYPMFESLVQEIAEIIAKKQLNEGTVNKIINKLLT